MNVTLLGSLGESVTAPAAVSLPHVVAWNLTKRCNLECAHCYISAGPGESTHGELTTSEFKRITDEILELNPAPMFILSGGEPLLREDLPELALYASRGGATVVVGTNGTLLTDDRIDELEASGVTGVAVSVESLDAAYHDRFRRGHGSLSETLSAVQRLATHKMDFVIQTTITKGNRRELSSIVEWASDSGAVSFNAYFVVSTGRAERMRGLDPEEQEEVLESLVDLHFEHLGKMMVRAKCAPQFMRLVHQRGENTPLMNYGTRCPCGVQYCRITPEGKVTPCPYLPVSGGDLRRDLFATVWQDSELFRQLRVGNLGGRCGVCEYRAVCGGCRARAHAVEGDFLAADPSCAYEPTGDRELILPPVSVTYGSELSADSALHWTPEAEERLRRVPSFVRGVVINRIESYARERGLTEITAELMRDIRSAMPVDFAKRKPFFMNDD